MRSRTGPSYVLSRAGIAFVAISAFLPVLARASGSMSRGDPAADVSWSAAFGGLGTANDIVSGFTIDGTDLIAVGRFTQIGPLATPHVARWDGSQWHALGGGIPNDASNSALCAVVYHDQLYVGGNFSGGVLRWDGSAWGDLQGGVDGVVNALAVYDDQLIVGGDFSLAGSIFGLNDLAAWDGQTWHAYGPPGGSKQDAVRSLTVYNGALIAGGVRTNAQTLVTTANLARFDGTTWSFPATFSSPSAVYALGSYHGSLVVGGNFATVAGLPAACIASWDGSVWSALGSGIVAGTRAGVEAMTVLGDSLIVVGDFGTAGGLAVNDVAAWNGNAWVALSTGLGGGPSPNVQCAITYDGAALCGGTFTSAGPVNVGQLAAWTGSAWGMRARGVDGAVYALLPYKGLLVAGGKFTHAGDVPMRYIAGWDGTRWQRLGNLAGPIFAFGVRALCVYNGDLIAGGDFSFADGAAVNGIARWDGAHWTPLGSGVAGGQDYTSVDALAAYNGDLYVGGRFATAGGVSSPYLARWDGTTWHAVTPSPDAEVLAMLQYGERLAMAGNFFHLGSDAYGCVALWNGATFDSLGAGADGGVAALALDGDNLVAGGGFTGNGRIGAFCVEEWNGATWDNMAGGVGYDDVLALATYNHSIAAGGVLNGYNGLTRWAGAAPWGYFGDALVQGGTVLALAVMDSSLYVGGSFVAAGDKVSTNIGRWTETMLTATPDPRVEPPAAQFAGARPNPCRAATTLYFTQPAPGPIQLDILDVRGALVRTALRGVVATGSHTASWDGRDAAGRRVAAGVYVVRLRGAGVTRVAKLVVMR